MQHGDGLGEAHDHFHVVLHDDDGQVLGDATHELDRGAGLADAHARRGLVEAEELGLGGEGDADLEVALGAVREVGGQLLFLRAQPDRLQHGAGAVDQVRERIPVAQHVPRVVA